MPSKPTMTLQKAFGPLWKLYNDPEVHEIIVDGKDDVYYDKKGKILNGEKVFKDEKQIETTIKNLAQYAGKKIDPNCFQFDLTINQDTRIHVVLPPISFHGPILNLMRLPKQDFDLEQLQKWKALDEKSLSILRDKIKTHVSMLVAGPLGSGKTTLLNCILKEIPLEERMVTIESAPNLVLNRKRCARLIAQEDSTAEMKELIKSSLKMRADRLVISYIQGPEALDFINAVREGHTGYAGFTAENVFDVIRRLEIMLMSSDPVMTLDNARYSIAQAFKTIVFQEKVETGGRKVTAIADIIYEGGEISLKPLYRGV